MSRANLEEFNSGHQQVEIDRMSSAPSLSLAKVSKKPPVVPVNEIWKEKESLKKMTSQAFDNKQRFLQMLLKLDKEYAYRCAVMQFLQMSIDQDINFDEKSISYITKRADAKGEINYLRFIKDMVIRFTIDVTGSIILRWHIQSALTPAELKDKNALIVSS